MAAPYSQHYLPEMTATPLATLLASHVDIDALRSPAAPRVYVTITNVRTGLPRIVSNPELTIDVLLASTHPGHWVTLVWIAAAWQRGCPVNWHRVLNRADRRLPPKTGPASAHGRRW